MPSQLCTLQRTGMVARGGGLYNEKGEVGVALKHNIPMVNAATRPASPALTSPSHFVHWKKRVKTDRQPGTDRDPRGFSASCNVHGEGT